MPNWTKAQQAVIDSRGKNLLVSAAAGSGKTAVLVERIVGQILDKDNPIDIDRMLVLTFTNAAAAEMRERIGKKLQEKVDEGNADALLLRQLTLVHHAQITTIDSFCLWLVKNYFEQCDVEPGFRIMDEGEKKLLEADVVSEMIESFFEKKDPDFMNFASRYIGVKGDKIQDMVLSMYEKAQGFDYPMEWVDNMAAIDMDIDSSDWTTPGKWLNMVQLEVTDSIDYLINETKGLSDFSTRNGMSGMGAVCNKMISAMQDLLTAATYDDFRDAIIGVKFPSADFKGANDPANKDVADKWKKNIKKGLDDIKDKYLNLSLEGLKFDSGIIKENMLIMAKLVHDFSDRLYQIKKQKNMYDFSDIEHKALEILVDSKTKKPTDVAVDLRGKFDQIMTDEYQDSNYLQEAILEALSRGNNRFIVGDVKQSIYRFREGKPALFTDKQKDYSDTANSTTSEVILLDQNFRSRQGVIDSVNDIFFDVMKEHTGGVGYGEAESLKLGASFDKPEDDTPEYLKITDTTPEDKFKTEVMLIDNESFKNAGVSKDIAEAKTIANRILALKKDGIKFSDIVILVRALTWVSDIKKELEDVGIPVYVTSSKGYFSATEVQLVLSFIKVIDNPCQDIPLAAVMRSVFGGFTDDDLVYIKGFGKGRFLFDDLEAYAKNGDNDALKTKVNDFLKFITDYRQQMRFSSVSEIIKSVVEKKDYLRYLMATPGGMRRVANINTLIEKAISFEKTSYRGVFSFTRYIDQLNEYEVDFGEADVTDGTTDVVRIMTIHKSKGLQFPVVFVSGCGRELNRMDTRGDLLLDDRLGMGFKVVDTNFRSKRDNAYRLLVSDRINSESVGEEERVLYVALTRAMHKLIITGGLGELEKNYAKFQRTAEKLAKGIQYTAAEESAFENYLEMIVPSAINNPSDFIISHIFEKDIKLAESANKAQLIESALQVIEQTSDCDEDIYKQIEGRFATGYKYQAEVDLKSKLSVSEIKHKFMNLPGDEHFINAKSDEDENVLPQPSFLTGGAYKPFAVDNDANDGAKYGTAMHRFLECIDYDGIIRAKTNSESAGDITIALKNETNRQLEELHNTGIIDDDTYAKINVKKIATFLDSELVDRIMKAHSRGELYREQPFVMGLEYSKFDSEIDSDAKALIQGIIDLYFVEDGKIILLDYKTDRIKTPEELVDRYAKQLELYATALARYYEAEVGEIMMYSFALEQVVEVPVRAQL